jgi:hypothetical protein
MCVLPTSRRKREKMSTRRRRAGPLAHDANASAVGMVWIFMRLLTMISWAEAQSWRDLAIPMFTQSRAQGNVDKIPARRRPDLSVPVEEAEDTWCCLAQRIVNEQCEYARSLVGSQVLLAAPVATAVAAAEEEAEAPAKAEAPQ